MMKVLIVESNSDLGSLWQRHLHRQGMAADLSLDGDSATRMIETQYYDVIVLDLILETGSAFAVADYARFRHPSTNIIFVTDTAFFSDGSIFALMPNARAFLESHTPPDDLAAMIEHYGRTPANNQTIPPTRLSHRILPGAR